MNAKRKLYLLLATFFAMATLALCLTRGVAAVTYQKGSSGSVVTQIQNKLKDWGYYTGEADGVYGSKTEAPVRHFQERNGLAVDGRAGPATLKALGIQAGEAASAQAGVHPRERRHMCE